MKRRIGDYISGLITGMLLCAILLLLMKFFGIRLFTGDSIADQVQVRADVVGRYVEEHYWKEEDISAEKMADYAAKGMVSALGDKYSTYYTAQEYEDAMNSVNGDYCGIGATVKLDAKTKKKIISEVKPGEPADKAGLKAGDEITKVNGVSVADMALSDVVAMIRGEAGKESVLTVSREEDGETKTLEIKVTCEVIVEQSIEYRMLSGSVGYIRITTFNKESVKQFEDALDGLEKKGEKSLILDVRDNGGGSLSAVVDMLDCLLPAGKIVTEQSKGKEDKEYMSTDEKKIEKPMAVLINGSSASASEVFAGALQDRGAASLVGVKSYGKGIVQTIYSLQETGGGIKLTTGEYLLPSGRSIHEEGLTPDVEVEYTGDAENYKEEEDNQLQMAVETVKNKLEKNRK